MRPRRPSLRAYTQFHRYDPERPFKTWLFSIASHYCIDRLRRRRVTWLDIDDEPLAGHPALREKRVGPEDSALQGERASRRAGAARDAAGEGPGRSRHALLVRSLVPGDRRGDGHDGERGQEPAAPGTGRDGRDAARRRTSGRQAPRQPQHAPLAGRPAAWRRPGPDRTHPERTLRCAAATGGTRCLTLTGCFKRVRSLLRGPPALRSGRSGGRQGGLASFNSLHWQARAEAGVGQANGALRTGCWTWTMSGKAETVESMYEAGLPDDRGQEDPRQRMPGLRLRQ